MRSLRTIKFRKKYKKITILTELLLIWYATLIIVGVLTSDTLAYVSDSTTSHVSIQSGSWWDGSELYFVDNNTTNIKACAPTELNVEVKNIGASMVGPTKFEIYYFENGNPEVNGHKVTEGNMQPIDSGKIATITFTAEKNGSYALKLLQRTGYKNNYEKLDEVWSSKYMVKCIEKSSENSNKVITSEDGDEATKGQNMKEEERKVVIPEMNTPLEPEDEIQTDQKTNLTNNNQSNKQDGETSDLTKKGE